MSIRSTTLFTAALTLCAILSVSLLARADEKMAGDRMADDKMTADQKMKDMCKDMCNDPKKMEDVKNSIMQGGPETKEMKQMIVREMAEKQMMKDPEMMSKMREMMKDPEMMKMRDSDEMMKMREAMMKDPDQMRKMAKEMMIRSMMMNSADMKEDGKMDDNMKEGAK